MSAIPRTLGVFALWATLCVVLLACAWPGAARNATGNASPGLIDVVSAPLHAASVGTPSLPSPPAPELPAAEPPAIDTASDAETAPHAAPSRLLRRAWVAVVPLWPSDALRWQRLEPSLRLNPGHAPPQA